MENNCLQFDINMHTFFKYRKSISTFVNNRKLYFILDFRQNSILNMKLNLDYDLEQGDITLEEYQNSLNARYYRDGIWQLTKDNFEQYLELDSVVILEQDELKELLFQGFSDEETARLYTAVENRLFYNTSLSKSEQQNDTLKIYQIASRMPLFYVNFDTEVYMHMDWGLNHAYYVYDGWFAKEMDFGYLIPDEFCYWKIDGRDYWKFRQWER